MIQRQTNNHETLRDITEIQQMHMDSNHKNEIEKEETKLDNKYQMELQDASF